VYSGYRQTRRHGIALTRACSHDQNNTGVKREITEAQYVCIKDSQPGIRSICDERWAKHGLPDRALEQLQLEQIVRIGIEAFSLNSTSMKVHPDGAGA